MRFKRFINEAPSKETDELFSVIGELGRAIGKINIIDNYSVDLKYYSDNIDDKFGKGIGEYLNKDFTVYDENGKKFDMTKTKIVRFGSDRPDLGVINDARIDVYNYLYNDGKYHFGFNDLLKSVGEDYGWKNVNKLIVFPVEEEVNERFIIPLVEDIAQEYTDLLENFIKECRKVNKKVFGDPDYETSPYSSILQDLEKYLKKYNTLRKMAIEGFYNKPTHFKYYQELYKVSIDFGGKDLKFWTKLIEDLTKEMRDLANDANERVSKSADDLADAYGKSISSVLGKVGLKGRTFVAMTKLASDKDTGIHLYEIDSVSDIENIKEIFRERTVKYRENAEKERKEKEEWDREHDWYHRYGSRYDF